MRSAAVIIAIVVAACGQRPPEQAQEPAPRTIASAPDAGVAAVAAPDAAVALSSDVECRTDGDCMVYCPAKDGCCSSAPCGCQQAIPRGRKADVDAVFAASCDPVPQCLHVACAYEEALWAACEGGRCVAKYGP
jgi:hypothetical protein